MSTKPAQTSILSENASQESFIPVMLKTQFEQLKPAELEQLKVLLGKLKETFST
jgi:hypothetical protein